ncbi:MAG: hypothetical protein ACYC61_14620 [Isosphaeraceae bacterium]
MPTPSMTEEEIIAYLGKTSLPTLLVEGVGDAAVYRWLESQLGIFNGNVLHCSGRTTLLSIYRKRDTFPHGKVAWLADLDMWRFSSPPSDLDGIVFTEGYSIENDLYAGSRIEDLLDDDERKRHRRLQEVVCRWFAFEVGEFLAGREHQVTHHPQRIVDAAEMVIAPGFVTKRGYAEPDPALAESILGNYQLSLRGKTLVQVLVEHLSSAKRDPKYSGKAIIEMCLKLYPDNPYMRRIVAEAKRRLV